MRVGSLFSGVGGLDLGLQRAGHEIAWHVEADEYRRAVLARRFRDAEVFDDVCAVGAADLVPVDLIAGGFPCQDVSVAGKRAGLAGARTGLFWEFVRIIDELKPRWVLLENVPGLLTSNAGRDFGVVLEALADLGLAVSWRVLDSRHFGVPQRRRRVFLVGHARGDGCAAVLLESEGGDGDLTARGATRPALARAVAERAAGDRYWIEDGVNAALTAGNDGGRSDRRPLIVPFVKHQSAHHADDHETWGETEMSRTLHAMGAESQTVVAYGEGTEVTEAITTKWAKGSGGPAGDETQNLAIVGSHDVAAPLQGFGDDGSRVGDEHSFAVAHTLLGHKGKDGSGLGPDQTFVVADAEAATLTGGGHPNSNMPGRRKEDDINLAVAFSVTPESGQGADLRATEVATSPAIAATDGAKQTDRGVRIALPSGVRRLTPVECERLQGFPDNWTCLCEPPCSSAEPKCPVSRRYAALGDAVTVTVGQWIGHRLAAADLLWEEAV